VIRVITETEVEAFRALRLRALMEEPEAFGASAEEFATTSLPDVAKRLQPTDNAFVLGAFLPDLGGMVGLVREHGQKRAHKAFIWGMYVAPEARGQGIGRSLMTAALARAAQLPGLEQIHLDVVSTNAAATTLYRSLGFISYGTEPHALKLGDHYVDTALMAQWIRNE